MPFPRHALCAALILLAAASPGHAADGFGTDCRIGMSEADFTKANIEHFDKGMRLVDITVAEDKGKPVIGAIWQRYSEMPKGSPERTKDQLSRVFLKLDEAGLREKGQAMGATGSQVEVIDAYQAAGKTWFAASFSPAKEPIMQTVGAFLTPEMFKGMREDATKQDNDIVRVDAYADGDQLKTFPVFVGRGASEIQMKIFDRTISIYAESAGLYLQDMHPLSISVFEQGGQTLWLATWDKSQSRDFILTDAGDEIRERIAKGGVVLDIDSQNAFDGSVSYYAVVQGGK